MTPGQGYAATDGRQSIERRLAASRSRRRHRLRAAELQIPARSAPRRCPSLFSRKTPVHQSRNSNVRPARETSSGTPPESVEMVQCRQRLQHDLKRRMCRPPARSEIRDRHALWMPLLGYQYRQSVGAGTIGRIRQKLKAVEGRGRAGRSPLHMLQERVRGWGLKYWTPLAETAEAFH